MEVFIQLETSIIHFGNIATTMMQCKKMEVENTLAKALSNRILRYKIEDLNLKLEGYDETLMVFQKIDKK
ncbi:MAG: META domain-containing protein [Flammeovirgaceae bacterium]|nr:META domain-containing protein [Flammeovirgaceae bacterium]